MKRIVTALEHAERSTERSGRSSVAPPIGQCTSVTEATPCLEVRGPIGRSTVQSIWLRAELRCALASNRHPLACRHQTSSPDESPRPSTRRLRCAKQ